MCIDCCYCKMSGDTWYYSFMRRHPEISLRTPQALGHDRALITEEIIIAWFRDLLRFLQEEWPTEYKGMLNDPRRILNCDESGFPLHTQTGKVVSPTGTKHVYQVTNSDRTQITVMCGFNAMGQYLPPMIYFLGREYVMLDCRIFWMPYITLQRRGGWQQMHSSNIYKK